MELHDPDIAKAYEALIYREDLNPSLLDSHPSSSQTQESFANVRAAEAPLTDSGYLDDHLDDHSAHSELLERRGSGHSRKEDHESVMHRSFSPLAGLALGFRYGSLIAGKTELVADRNLLVASPIHGLDISAVSGRIWHMPVPKAWFLD